MWCTGWTRVTIDEVNALGQDAFVIAFGWVYEHSPWVAEQAWSKRPFRSLDDLHGAMVDVVQHADAAAQRALLGAHPDLGARARMTDASSREQSAAGLDALTPDEYARFARLNGTYRETFGFPFIYAVKGSTKSEILDALDLRTRSTVDEERAEGLRQVARIARWRLEELMA